MPNKTLAEQTFDQVIVGMDEKLRPLGFRKRDRTWRRPCDGNMAVIEVQRNKWNTKNNIGFTVNTGVICGVLLEDWQPPIGKAREVDAHLRKRLGRYAIIPRDIWWTIKPGTRSSAIIRQLAPLLNKADSFLLGHSRTADLINLWRTGVSPGLTEKQREQYLNELTARL
jgi:hypothetical protein